MLLFPYPQKVRFFEELNETNTVTYITDTTLNEEEYKINIEKNGLYRDTISGRVCLC